MVWGKLCFCHPSSLRLELLNATPRIPMKGIWGRIPWRLISCRLSVHKEWLPCFILTVLISWSINDTKWSMMPFLLFLQTLTFRGHSDVELRVLGIFCPIPMYLSFFGGNSLIHNLNSFCGTVNLDTTHSTPLEIQRPRFFSNSLVTPMMGKRLNLAQLGALVQDCEWM